MEYGKKYCPDSPTIEEIALHRAIVQAIREVIDDNGCQTALKNLQLHIQMYYGGEDDSNTAADEILLNQLKDEVMEKAKSYEADSDDFMRLSQEIAEVKKRIAEKREKQITTGTAQSRMNEVLDMLNILKNHPIEYDDHVVRQLISCIKVITKHELLVIFKGGIEKTVSMK